MVQSWRLCPRRSVQRTTIHPLRSGISNYCGRSSRRCGRSPCWVQEGVMGRPRTRTPEDIARQRREAAARYRARHPEKALESVKRYNKNNLPKLAAYSARRRATKAKATPKWLSSSDHDMMAGAYQYAKQLRDASGYDWHVDHIIPLCSKIVCGLHVPWNLQLLPAKENHRKGNRF